METVGEVEGERGADDDDEDYVVAQLRVLDDDALDDGRRGLGRVDRPLEPQEYVTPADHDHRVDPVREQRGDRVAVDPVPVVLQAVDLDPVIVEVLEAAQVLESP